VSKNTLTTANLRDVSYWHKRVATAPEDHAAKRFICKSLWAVANNLANGTFVAYTLKTNYALISFQSK
jgi:hypothetical protein